MTPAAHLLSRARMMYVAANRKRFFQRCLLADARRDRRRRRLALLGSGRPQVFSAVISNRSNWNRAGRSRTFIAEVMPSYPLYVPLLPAEAQRVLGEPDDGALLAYDIHLEEGFEPDRFVDIFDAGPVLTVAVGTQRVGGRQRDSPGARHAAKRGRAVPDRRRRRTRISLRAGRSARGKDAGSTPSTQTCSARSASGVNDPVRCVPLHQASGELQ